MTKNYQIYIETFYMSYLIKYMRTIDLLIIKSIDKLYYRNVFSIFIYNFLGLVFIFPYIALVKYRPISKMAVIVNSYRQMLIGVRLQAHADLIKLAETVIKLI